MTVVATNLHPASAPWGSGTLASKGWALTDAQAMAVVRHLAVTL